MEEHVLFSDLLQPSEHKLMLATERLFCLNGKPDFKFDRKYGRVLVTDRKLSLWEKEFEERKAPKLKQALAKLREGLEHA